MENENVVQMLTLLERLAGQLNSCLRQEWSNRREWIAIQIEKCATLLAIRRQFVVDIEFGQWCNDNGFGPDTLNHQDRAAAIQMGAQPEALHRCLKETSRNSLQTIYKYDFPRFTNVSKPTRRKVKSPKLKKAIETYDELKADGISITRNTLSEAAGVGQNTALRAMLLKHADETMVVEPIIPADMGASTRKRYEAALRKAKRELRDEITQEISDSYQAMLDRYRQRLADADRIIASHKGVMSRDAFRKIKACLHPDHNTFKFASEALQAFSELEKVLVKPDAPVMTGPPLPRTAAELMARRRSSRAS